MHCLAIPLVMWGFMSSDVGLTYQGPFHSKPCKALGQYTSFAKNALSDHSTFTLLSYEQPCEVLDQYTSFAKNVIFDHSTFTLLSYVATTQSFRPMQSFAKNVVFEHSTATQLFLYFNHEKLQSTDKASPRLYSVSVPPPHYRTIQQSCKVFSQQSRLWQKIHSLDIPTPHSCSVQQSCKVLGQQTRLCQNCTV